MAKDKTEEPPEPMVDVQVNAGSVYIDTAKKTWIAGNKLRLPKGTADALIRAGTMKEVRGSSASPQGE